MVGWHLALCWVDCSSSDIILRYDLFGGGRGGSFRFLRFFEENVGADRRLAGPRVTLLMTSGWAPIAGRGGYGGYGRYGVVLFFYTKVLRLGWGRPSSNTWQTRLDWHPWTNSRAVDSGQLQATICGTEGCWQVPSQRLILTLYTSDYLTSLILHTTLEVFEGSSDDHYSVEQFPSFPLPSSLSVPSILVTNLVPPSRQPVSQFCLSLVSSLQFCRVQDRSIHGCPFYELSGKCKVGPDPLKDH